jgi:hypothetical protein
VLKKTSSIELVFCDPGGIVRINNSVISLAHDPAFVC